jgi:hypothetical protein
LFTFGKGPVHLDIGTGFVYASFKFIIVNWIRFSFIPHHFGSLLPERTFTSDNLIYRSAKNPPWAVRGEIWTKTTFF